MKKQESSVYEVLREKILSLELKPGINEITITGKGKVSFSWNDEVMG